MKQKFESKFQVRKERRKLEERIKKLSHLRRDEITWTLLDGDLAPERVRHLPSIPLEPLPVIVIAVEEVDLARRLLYLGMEEQHLEKGPRPALPHPDYYRLW